MFKFFNNLIKRDKSDSIKSLEAGNLTELFQVYLLLYSKDKLIVRNSLRVLINTVREHNIEKLEMNFRRGYEQYYYRYDYWTEKEPLKLINKKELTDIDKVTILGLSSLHPNGYYRERALKYLRKFNTGLELKFFINRVNDWVENISIYAKTYCLRMITRDNLDKIAFYILDFINLSRLNRYNHIDILDSINNLFSDKANLNYVLNGIRHENQRVRKYFYDILVNKDIIEVDIIIKNLRLEKNSYIKYAVLTDLIQHLDRDDIINNYHFFINDKNPQIRFLIIYTLVNLEIDDIKTIIYPFIFDSSNYIGYYSRNILSQFSDYNLVDIYRNELQIGLNIVGSINGLAQIGNKSAIPLIKGYLDNNNIRIVRASLQAISKLDNENNQNIFLKYLEDERIGVSKTAFLIIKANIYYYNDKSIYVIYQNTNTSHVKKFTTSLLISFSKWISLRYILEFLSSNDDYIFNLGTSSLKNWINNVNKAFIKPTNQEIKAIKEVLDNVKDKLDKDQLERVLLSFSDYDRI